PDPEQDTGVDMRKSTKVVAIAAATLVTALAACSEGDPGTEPADEAEGTMGDGEFDLIGFMVQDLSNPFFLAMEEGLKAQADEMGVEVNTQDGRQDLNAQNDQIDTFIQQGVDAIILNAVDSESIGPAVQRAIDAGIVVVVVDVEAPGAMATVTLDNRQAGEIACEYLIEQIGGSGPILLVDGTPITSVQHRVEGCQRDRKSTRLNSSHVKISYAVFCLKKKKNRKNRPPTRKRI